MPNPARGGGYEAGAGADDYQAHLPTILHESEDVGVARVRLAQGQWQQALALAEGVVASAAAGGRDGYLLEAGPPMERLLAEVTDRGAGAGCAERLRSAFPGESGATKPPSPQPSHPGTQPLAEPLSARELEVLALIAGGLSNQEIGARLFISLPTVKAHARNIYAKLDVASRTQAVAKARSLDLLPPD